MVGFDARVGSATRPSFYGRSSNPEKMLRNFLARSHWFNALVQAEAGQRGMHVLRQPGDVTVDALCDRALEHLGSRAPRPILA